MKTSIHAKMLSQSLDVERIFHAAAGLGIDGVELPIAPEGKLSYEAPQETWEELRRRSIETGVAIAALCAEGFAESHFASEAPAVRQQAMQRVIFGLERARWCGSQTLIVAPMGDGSGPLGVGVPIEELLAMVLDALRHLRFKALPHAVRIACDMISEGRIATPTEARRFMDEVNSPFVGLSLNLLDRCIADRAPDWFRSLGHRLAWVTLDETHHATHAAEGSSSDASDRPEERSVTPPLEARMLVRYDGFVGCRGTGDPADIVRRLRALCGTVD